MRKLLLILFAGCLAAADLPVVQPGGVGFSADRLSRATQAIEADVAVGRIPGALGLVARRGRIVYQEVRGDADREAHTPMREDTIFRIYSMSKPITTVGLMMLFEEGKFRLTDPVSRYLPELKNPQVLIESAGYPGDPERARREPAKREITIQDLMRHTAGLTYGYFGGTSVDKMYVEEKVLDNSGTLADMVTKLGRLPLLYQPGEKWRYSVAVDVQGRLIEVLSGERFDRYLQRRIFDPLGMADTGFDVPKESLGRFAQMYAPLPGDREKLKPAPAASSERYKAPGTFFSGGGGLVSTAHDYLRFCQMALNGGELDGVRILSRTTVNLMTRDHATLVDPSRVENTGYGFGLGFAVHVDPAASGSASSVGELNWGGAAGTKFWIDPKEGLIGIYMVQILPHAGLRYGEMFKQLVYQAIAD
jgi:CubicO group peptidase (beta-lactamase class C family)